MNTQEAESIMAQLKARRKTSSTDDVEEPTPTIKAVPTVPPVQAETPAPVRDTSSLTGLSGAIESAPDVVIKYVKSVWTSGLDATPVLDTENFVIDPYQCARGYIAFTDKNELVDSFLNSVLTPMMRKPETKDEWLEQYSVTMKNIDTQEQGNFSTSSKGGKKAVGRLANAIGSAARRDDGKVFPVVQLGTSPYQHPIRGLVHNPVFKIVGWLDEDEVNAL